MERCGGRAFRIEETAHAKALGQHHAWCEGGTMSTVSLEQSEQGGEREEVRAGRGQEQVTQRTKGSGIFLL